jgi:hypothetical protein
LLLPKSQFTARHKWLFSATKNSDDMFFFPEVLDSESLALAIACTTERCCENWRINIRGMAHYSSSIYEATRMEATQCNNWISLSRTETNWVVVLAGRSYLPIGTMYWTSPIHWDASTAKVGQGFDPRKFVDYEKYSSRNATSQSCRNCYWFLWRVSVESCRKYIPYTVQVLRKSWRYDKVPETGKNSCTWFRSAYVFQKIQVRGWKLLPRILNLDHLLRFC